MTVDDIATPSRRHAILGPAVAFTRATPLPVQYPKAGTTNSAARVGVVSATGGTTKWLVIRGDPRNTYIARMEWAGQSSEVVLQHLNRLQNTLTLYLGDARSGAVKPIVVERDSAWVDVVNDLRWLDGGTNFTWVSERSGWRHLYVVSRDGTSSRDVTPGALDIVNPGYLFGEPFVLGTDERSGTIYFTASPDNPTQLYLYRARLDGQEAPARVTPASQAGTHGSVPSFSCRSKARPCCRAKSSGRSLIGRSRLSSCKRRRAHS